PDIGFAPEEIADSRRSAEAKGDPLFVHARSLSDGRMTAFLSALDDLRKHASNVPALIDAIRASGVIRISEEMDTAFKKFLERDQTKTAGTLIRHLYEEYGLLEAEGDVSQEDKVLLCTLHSSKGLEARTVFILHLD